MEPNSDQLDRAQHPAAVPRLDPVSRSIFYIVEDPVVTDPANEEILQTALTGRTKADKRRILLTQQALVKIAGGVRIADVADQLGVSHETLVAYLSRHRRAVEAKTIDRDLDEIAVPLAKENLIHGLMAGDKTYTLETLKGRGKLRRHTENENRGPAELPTLKIEFVTPPGQTALAAGTPSVDSTIAGGRIAGAIAWPKQIAGTVIARTPLEETPTS